jgi:hypothetical protein
MTLLPRRLVLATGAAALMTAGALMGWQARADQPHMHAALDALKSARSELDKADPDKGGHRAKALELVRDAIAQVERGIEFDRHH